MQDTETRQHQHTRYYETTAFSFVRADPLISAIHKFKMCGRGKTRGGRKISYFVVSSFCIFTDWGWSWRVSLEKWGVHCINDLCIPRASAFASKLGHQGKAAALTNNLKKRSVKWKEMRRDAKRNEAGVEVMSVE